WRTAARAANAATCEFGVVRRVAVTARFSLRANGSELQLRTPAGDAAVTLNVPGRHMVANALAATAAALAARVPLQAIVRGLAQFRPLPGRLATLDSARGVHVID